MNLLLLILLLVVLILPTMMMQRRQRRELARIQQVQEDLVIGDHVVSNAGLHAVVRGIDDTTVELETSPSNISVWEKAAIVRNLSQDERESAQAQQVAQPVEEAPEAPLRSEQDPGEQPQR
ncbi:preprotein translocase subunit YajC [Corynebacterium pseudopelargi]|uniref:Preprotein translocase subunit YajC n=1 Tax=Corynebacterium pseudopelargi TaxID=2080757 RepID=A0A3G6IUB0_9CORY|nr:preprotein translocase subunit YajC [Corynebacterium pseudopelargi]AZA09157.1 preprotein translocase subunit YajC [Corynebacterium pseudopelargi]